MWIARQPSAVSTDLATEMIEVFGFKPTFEKGSCVDSGGCVTLEVHVIAETFGIFATEEVVEANFVERSR